MGWKRSWYKKRCNEAHLKWVNISWNFTIELYKYWYLKTSENQMSRHLLPEIWPLRYNMHLNKKENWSSFKVFFQCQVVLFKIQFLNLLNQNKRVMWKIKWKLALWSNGVQTPIDCYHNLTVCILSV